MSLIKQIKLETPESTTAYDIGAVATNVSLQNPITVEETQYTNVESALNAINNKSGGGGSADTSIIAEDFSTSKLYAVGDYVVYNGDLYICSTAHSAGAWDASHFTQITVTSELDTKMTKGKDYVTAGRSINSTAGTKSTAEGQGNTASGNYSHVEGNSNTASGQSSHAEGQNCTASKSQSHAEGSTTTASGKYAHSEGGATTASHEASHAEGYYTKTGASYQHVCGKFNVGKSTTLFEVGNGTSDNVRANAFEISSAGDVVAAGEITDGGGNVLSNKINNDAGFVHTDDITYNPDTKTVTCSKSANGYTSQLYSKSGYKDNVFLTFKPSQTNKMMQIGLNTLPAASSGYNDMDYCFNLQATGGLMAIEEGTLYSFPAGHTAYAVGDELRLEYSDGYVRYYHNGVLVRFVARAIGDPLYFDSSFYTKGEISIYDFNFLCGTQTGVVCVSYDANTDRGVEANRTAAMEAVIQKYGIGKVASATIRYASGFYHQYLFSYWGLAFMVLEIVWGGQIIFWFRDGSGNWTKNFTK